MSSIIMSHEFNNYESSVYCLWVISSMFIICECNDRDCDAHGTQLMLQMSFAVFSPNLPLNLYEYSITSSQARGAILVRLLHRFRISTFFTPLIQHIVLTQFVQHIFFRLNVSPFSRDRSALIFYQFEMGLKLVFGTSENF